jgi:quercetin dioxygenase-like cupin family protein
MLIKKKGSLSVPREDAHGGSGGRRLYATEGDLAGKSFSAMTYGFLPSGKVFDWHHHDGIEELMLVLRGKGIVQDREGTYEYESGDLFIFPANTEHRIENQNVIEDEFIFVRIKVSA